MTPGAPASSGRAHLVQGQELTDLLDLDRGVIARGGKRFCLHWYGKAIVVGAWVYDDCRCGRRRARRVYRNLTGPVDWEWLRG